MREVVAHVPFRGIIRERSVEPYLRLFKTLRTKRRVKGVLFDVSSGGGEVIASMDLYLAVKRLDQVKPVFASIGATGASGAYLAALGARRLFAYPESQVGSIGVVYAHFALRELARRLGVSVELLHAGVHKDAFQGYRPLTDEERGKIQAITQESYDQFVQLVARERKRPVEEIRTLATGEFWTGQTAWKLGLVDALADRELVLQELARVAGVPSGKVLRVGPPIPFLQRMLSGGANDLGGGLVGRVHDAVEDSLFDLGGFSFR
jgi:protease IV